MFGIGEGLFGDSKEAKSEKEKDDDKDKDSLFDGGGLFGGDS